MIFFTLEETLAMICAAIIIDWAIGDPKWPTHPVIWIGRWIHYWERKLNPAANTMASGTVRLRGIVLTLITLTTTFIVMWALIFLAGKLHPWLAYLLNTWFISTTIAVKGLKDAAYLVYVPLTAGRLDEARRYTGYIVGRDTDRLDEAGVARATIETVAENTVDAFVSPIVYALLGGAPLAMLYRAANTLDSMVGYKNEKFIDFGWASARTDDVLNYIPARITGILILLSAWPMKEMSVARGWQSIRAFAGLHPSPNSGIPESAAAGALGIELGGLNYYFGKPGERARMGWPLRPIEPRDIVRTVRLLYGVSIFCFAGGCIGWWFAG
ncbi:adenosylcobinamide-phosphate synthase CbiB [Paenibacillus tarimensis]